MKWRKQFFFIVFSRSCSLPHLFPLHHYHPEPNSSFSASFSSPPFLWYHNPLLFWPLSYAFEVEETIFYFLSRSCSLPHLFLPYYFSLSLMIILSLILLSLLHSLPLSLCGIIILSCFALFLMHTRLFFYSFNAIILLYY